MRVSRIGETDIEEIKCLKSLVFHLVLQIFPDRTGTENKSGRYIRVSQSGGSAIKVLRVKKEMNNRQKTNIEVLIGLAVKSLQTDDD